MMLHPDNGYARFISGYQAALGVHVWPPRHGDRSGVEKMHTLIDTLLPDIKAIPGRVAIWPPVASHFSSSQCVVEHSSCRTTPQKTAMLSKWSYVE